MSVSYNEALTREHMSNAVDRDVAARCLIIALVTLIGSVTYLWFNGFSAWYFLTIPVLWIPLAMIFSVVYSAVKMNSADEYDEFDYLPDTMEELFEQLSDTDETSPNIIGSFKGVDIYDWVKVSHPVNPQEKLLCHFDHVIRGVEELCVAEDKWYVVLEPGIVYVTR